MVLQVRAGQAVGEDVEDLKTWLVRLDDAPRVTTAVTAACASTAHADRATWFYVEADATAGVARRRCLACGTSTSTLDSAAHWTFPPMWTCRHCGQSIVELAAGLHEDDAGFVRWVALAARCVDCGAVEGLTDLVVDAPLDEVLQQL